MKFILLISTLFLVSCSMNIDTERDRIKLVKKLGGDLETAHCVEKNKFFILKGKEYTDYVNNNLCFPKYKKPCDKEHYITNEELWEHIEKVCGEIPLMNLYLGVIGISKHNALFRKQKKVKKRLND